MNEQEQQKDLPSGGRVLSREQVNEYHGDGYVIVENLLDEKGALAWKQQLKVRLQASNDIQEPSGVKVFWVDDLDKSTYKRVCDSRILDALQQLVGPDVEFLSVKAVFKNSQTKFASPWHRDCFYWHGSTKISVWIALDDATVENGCLQMSPGSHKDKEEGVGCVDDGKGFVHRLTKEQMQDKPIVTLEVKRGDGVFFHDKTLHASLPNSSGKDRWAAIATYRDSSVVDDSTVWTRGILLCGKSVNGCEPYDES